MGKPLKVLLTSGGTRVPIDDVRHIANMSRGVFGASIGLAGMEDHNWDLTFLCAEGSKTPFKVELDFSKKSPKEIEAMVQEYHHRRHLLDRYHEKHFKEFDSYAIALDECLKEDPDIVILAAAVSDYGTHPAHGKVRSGGDMTIQLYPLPKLISSVRAKAPQCTLVGFKLLVDCTEEALVQAAYKSILENSCDLVVANDWRSLQRNDHQVLLVRNQNNKAVFERYGGADLGKRVAAKITQAHLAKVG